MSETLETTQQMPEPPAIPPSMKSKRVNEAANARTAKASHVAHQRLVVRHVNLLTEILNHQIANRGTPYAYYLCYTYNFGKMPDWVKKAEKLVRHNKKTK